MNFNKEEDQYNHSNSNESKNFDQVCPIKKSGQLWRDNRFGIMNGGSLNQYNLKHTGNPSGKLLVKSKIIHKGMTDYTADIRNHTYVKKVISKVKMNLIFIGIRDNLKKA